MVEQKEGRFVSSFRIAKRIAMRLAVIGVGASVAFYSYQLENHCQDAAGETRQCQGISFDHAWNYVAMISGSLVTVYGVYLLAGGSPLPARWRDRLNNLT